MALEGTDNGNSSENNLQTLLLTPWWPVCEYIVPENQPKASSFRLPYQHPSSSADCIRELFKPSEDSASVLVCTL